MGMCVSLQGGGRKEKKRLEEEVRNAEAKAAQLLAEMPGRLCSNAATQTSSLHTKEGWKGINQDSMIVWEGFAAKEETVFLGVFDGHGPNGHMVARKVRDCLPSLLTLPLENLVNSCDSIHNNIYKPIKISNTKDSIELDNDIPVSKVADETQYFDAEDEDSGCITKRINAAFHKMDERLKSHPKISCMSSGTTAVAILLQGNDLVVGSVGDSRAILATRSVDGSLVANPLTVELKPDSPGEKERILKCHGRVFALDDEPHIQRLWLPHASSPGLAMARAFGDFCLKEYGLIATPKISHRKLAEEDEFIVLATDGVWDVLTNTEVMEAISLSESKDEAAKSIVDAATGAWKGRNLENRMDDCTVVCHFLNHKKPRPSISGSSNAVKGKERKQSDDNASNDQRENLQFPQSNQGLARYDTVVATDLADDLNTLELVQLREKSQESEKNRPLHRYDTLETAHLAELA